jgi:hypothetical protein
MQLGKMYLVKDWFWFLYPTKELAMRGRSSGEGAMTLANGRLGAEWLSQEFKCNVGVVEPNTCFVLLEVDEVYFKVLDCNGNIGWTYCFDFSGYFELVKE